MGLAVFAGPNAVLAQVADLPSGELSSALEQLARSSHISLLFDKSIMSGKAAPAVHGAATVDVALSRLLTGSGLESQRLANGSYVIRPLTLLGLIAARSAPAMSDVIAVPEVLVVGRRTINADIPRHEDDIQPYRVIGSDTIQRLQSFSVNDLLSDAVPANAQLGSLAQDPQGNAGTARSQIDMHGRGPEQTLMLIDGRRLPSVPSADQFIQSDLNGLPVGSIERVETLDTTAGALFGPGAAGGVVNVVLKHDFEGAGLGVDSGVSQRGDAERYSVHGRVGATGFDGHTQLMILGGYSQDDGLAVGERDFAQAERVARAKLFPGGDYVASPGVNFYSLDPSQPLTFKAALGGASLGASTTYLPAGSPAYTAGGVALLRANAGLTDLALSQDGQGAAASLVTPTISRSLVATLWQDLGPRVETFANVLWLYDEGRATAPLVDTTTHLLGAYLASDPFQQSVIATYSTPGLLGMIKTATVTERLTLGATARLWGGWTSALDGSLGLAATRQSQNVALYGENQVDLSRGAAGIASQLDPTTQQGVLVEKQEDRILDLNLRVGGPLAQLPGGPLSLQVTGEYREERNPGAFIRDATPTQLLTVSPTLSLTIPASVITERQFGQSQHVGSAFAELRAPITPKEGGFAPLRGLETQLAVRYDRYTTTEPSFLGATDVSEIGGTVGSINGLSLGAQDDITNAAGIISVTAGAKVTPAPGLTLRASFANGYIPPTAEQFRPSVGTFNPSLEDPQRGGLQTGSSSVVISSLGTPTLRPEHAQTFSVGAVVSPTLIPGLRFSIDYSVLRSSDEITNFAQGDYQYIVDHAAQFAGRVVRAPLSAADAALGYTGGQITSIDASSLQIGHSGEQFIDFSLDYDRALQLGILHFYTKATWTPSFRRRDDPSKPSYDLVGFADGPLEWRGQAGATWAVGPWSTTLNAQFYSGYEAFYATRPSTEQLEVIKALVADGTLPASLATTTTSGPHVPPQVYFDLNTAFRWRPSLPSMPLRTITMRLGIENLLDTRPPTSVPLESPSANLFIGGYYQSFSGYSPLGDPRGRMFKLGVSAAF